MSVARAEILTVPLPTEGLTAEQYRQLDEALKAWEAQVRENVKLYPAQSYELGQHQIATFLQMLGLVAQADLPAAGAIGPTKPAAVEWLQRYTLHEIDGALSKYSDEIRSSALYGMRGATNPTQVASWLYRATKDAKVDWRRIARTEMVRANAEGRLTAVKAMGYEEVWCPRHAGACEACKRLLEGQTFRLEDVQGKSNYGRAQKDWIACIPLHPHCRHVWLPAVPKVFDEAQAAYAKLEDQGLDDETLNTMFDSSGQVKPEYADDPRLTAYFEQAGKTVDPLAFVFGQVIEKTARREPPGLHHTSARKRCSICEHYERPDCTRYDWQVDADEVCATWEAKDVGKGFFDNPQAGLDPLIWTTDEGLRPDVRDRVVSWWRATLGDDAPLWSRPYIVGSSTSRAWAGKKTAGDLDVHIVVDYTAFRAARPDYAALSDPELYAAFISHVYGVEAQAAPGLALEGFICSQATPEQFAADVAGNGQGVFDVVNAVWIVPPPAVADAEDLTGGEILEGAGGTVALEHPDWLTEARRLRDVMRDALDRVGADPLAVAVLGDAYQFVHDLRGQAFAPGGGGAAGLGNFLWRYLRDFGPLEQVKEMLDR